MVVLARAADVDWEVPAWLRVNADSRQATIDRANPGALSAARAWLQLIQWRQSAFAGSPPRVFFALSKTLDLVFSPLFLSLVFGSACAWAAGRRRVRAAWAWGIAASLALYLPATGLCARALFGYVERFDGPPARSNVSYDAVILLGGGFVWHGPDGALELTESVDRLLRAWELLASKQAARAIIAGGAPSGAEIEADAAADLLSKLGIERARLLLDRKSRNTRENALEVQAIVARNKLARLVLVTSAAHMQRAIECFRAVGLTPDVVATDHQVPHLPSWFDFVAPRASFLVLSERALRELAGRVVYRVRGFAQR